MDVPERFEQLIAYLESQLPTRRSTSRRWPTTRSSSRGGDPPVVVALLTHTSVVVSEFAGVWETPFSFVAKPRRVGIVKWRRLPENSLLAAISALIKGAREARFGVVQVCRFCGQRTAPEWLHDDGVCQSCGPAERPRALMARVRARLIRSCGAGVDVDCCRVGRLRRAGRGRDPRRRAAHVQRAAQAHDRDVVETARRRGGPRRPHLARLSDTARVGLESHDPAGEATRTRGRSSPSRHSAVDARVAGVVRKHVAHVTVEGLEIAIPPDDDTPQSGATARAAAGGRPPWKAS
mgnify:CR=1 FL=1